MNKTPDLKRDALCWIVLLLLAAVIAFSLLKRDKERNFGAVSFGAFPEISLKKIGGGEFNHHLMKSRLWAVHTALSEERLMKAAGQLKMVMDLTASGKRHMYLLSLTPSQSPILRPLNDWHYIVHADQERLKSIFSFLRMGDNMVVLVDQNGIIRGAYNIDDVDDYRKFQKDVMRIL